MKLAIQVSSGFDEKLASKKKVEECLKSSDISKGPHTQGHTCAHTHLSMYTHTDLFYTDINMKGRKKEKKDSVRWEQKILSFFDSRLYCTTW